jgi:hypothetical protein
MRAAAISDLPSRSIGWLWFTVLFANFAEAVAEGRGKAQAEALRRTRKVDTMAKRLTDQANSKIVAQWFGVKIGAGRSGAGRGGRTDSRPTAMWWKASHRSMSRPSPAKARPVIRESAATARR